VWWYISIIPATWEEEEGGLQFEASPSKRFADIISKTKEKQLGVCPKWQSTCRGNARSWVQSLVLKKSRNFNCGTEVGPLGSN
jgi:hypothetical protein